MVSSACTTQGRVLSGSKTLHPGLIYSELDSSCRPSPGLPALPSPPCFPPPPPSPSSSHPGRWGALSTPSWRVSECQGLLSSETKMHTSADPVTSAPRLQQGALQCRCLGRRCPRLLPGVCCPVKGLSKDSSKPISPETQTCLSGLGACLLLARWTRGCGCPSPSADSKGPRGAPISSEARKGPELP